MARYFFNLHDGVDRPDTVGTEQADLASVREEAVESLAERLKGTLLIGKDVSAWLMNITDEAGLTIMIVSFSAAVQTLNPHAPSIQELAA